MKTLIYIYIIDDVLSALDAHVGKEIYHNVMRGVLKDKTIIFITHALQYIKESDKIIVFKNGEIVEQGSYENLSQLPIESEFKRLAAFHSNNKNQENNEKSKIIGDISKVFSKETDKGMDNEKMKKGALMKAEERVYGSVPWKTYKIYITSGGTFFTFVTILLFS